MAVIQRSYIKDRIPQVHGWVFDVSSGQLIDLKINFTEILHSIQEIYDLTQDN